MQFAFEYCFSIICYPKNTRQNTPMQFVPQAVAQLANLILFTKIYTPHIIAARYWRVQLHHHISIQAVVLIYTTQ
jgi:hypothetical protein